MLLEEIYEKLGISSRVLELGKKAEKDLQKRFRAIDEICEYNQLKVIHAMQKHRVSEMHFGASTGYGYDDAGRENLEKVYAQVFKGEDALVRPQLVSGTHAISTALFGNLRPGDELLSPVGRPSA